MALRFRVTLPGIKGFYRVYDLKPSTTLYDFHKRMRDDMDFPHDQLIQFKALDAKQELVARYGMFDLGAGAVDQVSVKVVIAKGIASFIYFYDVPERKSVIVTYEGQTEDIQGVQYPLLSDSKGPNPIDFENGYIAYEDLPDDQKHLPGDKSKKKAEKSFEEILSGDLDDMLEEDNDEDLDDDFDDEEEEEEDSDDEDGQIIYDGSEDLQF